MPFIKYCNFYFSTRKYVMRSQRPRKDLFEATSFTGEVSPLSLVSNYSA